MFPADFDGIIAGSPGLDWSGRSAQAVRIEQLLQKEEARLAPSHLQALHAAVVAACDANDGLKDGVLEDPTNEPEEATAARQDSLSTGATSGEVARRRCRSRKHGLPSSS